MRKIIVFTALILSFCLSANAAIKHGVYPQIPESGKQIELYAEFGGTGAMDFNDFDANSPTLRGALVCDDFRGTLSQIEIDATGTDTSFIVGIYYDPYEPNSTLASTKVYKLLEISGVNAVTPDVVKYVIPSIDSSSNIYGGDLQMAKIYIGFKSTTHATLTNLKVRAYGKLE